MDHKFLGKVVLNQDQDLKSSSYGSPLGSSTGGVDAVDSHDNGGEPSLVQLRRAPDHHTTTAAASSTGDHVIGVDVDPDQVNGFAGRVTRSSTGGVDVVDSHDNGGEPSLVQLRRAPDHHTTTTAASSTGDHVIAVDVDTDQVNGFAGRVTRTSERSPCQLFRVDHQATVAANSQTDNNILAEYGEEENSFGLGRVALLILCFEAAVSLMASRLQPQGNSFPSSSSSASLSLHSSSSLVASSSFPPAMVWASNICTFTFVFMGMLLRKARCPTAAKVCNSAGLFSFVLVFYSMMAMFVPDHYSWMVWAAFGILLLVLTYSITGE